MNNTVIISNCSASTYNEAYPEATLESSLEDAFKNASNDYETVTDILLTKDESLSGNEGDNTLTVKSGQTIRLQSMPKEVEIGVTDLGYTLSLYNYTIVLEKQATLILDTNVTLGSGSSIKAKEQNSASNDFYAKLEINDSLTIDNSTSNENNSTTLDTNSGGALNLGYFNAVTLNGTINLESGEIKASDNTTSLTVNKDASIINIGGTISANVTGSGLYIYTDGNCSDKVSLTKTKAEVYIAQNTQSLDSNSNCIGTYILKTGTEYELNTALIVSNLTLIPFGDVKINVGTNGYFNVGSSSTLSLAGVSVSSSTLKEESTNTFYSVGSNKLILDGGANWQKNVNTTLYDCTGSSDTYYFVTKPYEAGMADCTDIETYGREQYKACSSANSSYPLIYGTSGSTINLGNNTNLQNRINTTSSYSDASTTKTSKLDATSNEHVGGAIALKGSTDNKANLNIYGANIRFNALPKIANQGGGAGIGAQYANITMTGGNISYNTVFDNCHANDFTASDNGGNSPDGAGVALIETSTFTMNSGSISYNHGGSAFNSDGAGIMVRNNSSLTINGGDISYNFTYGYGGGIAVWKSDVTLTAGNIYGNRSTYGGGIATTSSNDSNSKSKEATLTLNGNDINISYNTAFEKSTQSTTNKTTNKLDNNTKETGYGGGIALGNQQYKYNQKVTIKGGNITNNTAKYGGGISSYTANSSNTSGSNTYQNNLLILSGGYIANNKAQCHTYGDGIYIKSDSTGNNVTSSTKAQMLENNTTCRLLILSGAIEVNTTNNIVLSGFSTSTAPIYVSKLESNTNLDNTNEKVLTAKGIVGLIGLDSYSANTNIIEFEANTAVQLNKFLLDNESYKLEVGSGDCSQKLKIVCNSSSEYFCVNGTKYAHLKCAFMAAVQSNQTQNSLNETTNITIYVLQNKTLTADDADIEIPSGYNITLTSCGHTTYMLAISPDLKDSQTWFTVAQNASFTISNLIIDGNSSQSCGHLLVDNNGTFTLDASATVQNHKGMANSPAIVSVGRGKTLTNIKGEISGNIADYGAIYLSDPQAILNIYNNAKIINNTFTGTNDIGGNLTTLDIFLANGTINIGSESDSISSLKVDAILKMGGTINATNFSSSISDGNVSIGIKVADTSYKRNETIVNVSATQCGSAADQYSKYFTLLDKHNEYDSFKYEALYQGLVINAVLAIKVSFSDAWKYCQTSSSYVKETDDTFLNTIESNLDESKFNTNCALATLKTTLFGDKYPYDIKYLSGDHALVFYIDSTSGLELENILKNVALPGYEIERFILHSEDGTYSNNYLPSTTVTIAMYNNTISRISLGVVWKPLTFTFEFNNGGLTTSLGEMSSQTMTYTSLTSLNTLKYYATGFYFTGWKILISNNNGTKTYVKNSSNAKSDEDLVLQNGATLTNDEIISIQTQTGSTTFVLEAQWKSIFGGSNTIDNVGTSKETAFKIGCANALEVLALTVKGECLSTKGITGYYNAVCSNTLTYKPETYAGYYFTLDSDISEFKYVIGTSLSASDKMPLDETDSYPFSGNFDGNSKKITLSIEKCNEDYVGLFGYTKDANISNLTLSGSVKGQSFVGGLVGLAYGGNFSNIRNEATITFSGASAGGIIGAYYEDMNDTDSDSIRMVINSGSVTYSGAENTTPLYVENFSDDKVTPVFAGSRAGGIVGSSTHINLVDAYNNGKISALFEVGGIIGLMLSEDNDTRSNSTINTAFNNGEVEGTSGLAHKYQETYLVSAYVGGIAGRVYGGTTINNVMNTGSVKASWRGTYKVSSGTPTFTTTTEEEKATTSDDSSTTIGASGVGGIVGVTSFELVETIAYTGGNKTYTGGNKTISNAINTGSVEGFTHVGGIAGILAYSDMSYSMNVGNIKATGTISANSNNYAFMGALVGLGVSANLFSTSVFDGDIKYEGNTDSTIQAIGDEGANQSLGYAANSNYALKLQSAHLICQHDNTKPYGLDSTFFDSGWTWLSYDNDSSTTNYYYPQLISFVNSSVTFTSSNGNTLASELDKMAVSYLSKEAVTLKTSSSDVDSGHIVSIILELGQYVSVALENNSSISISVNDLNSITFTYCKTNNQLIANVTYATYKDAYIDLYEIAKKLSRPGYTFAGWYRDEDFTESFAGNIYLEDNTIYAKWEPTIYNINYTNVNAYVLGEVTLPTEYTKTFTINNTDTIKLLSSSELNGTNSYLGNGAYDFVAWEYLEGDKSIKVDSFKITESSGNYTIVLYYNNSQVGTTTLRDLEFRMLCEAHEFTITYNLSAEDGDEAKNPNPTYFTVESEFSLLPAERLGYNFIGWYTSKDFCENTKVEVISRGTVGNRSETYTLYAKFEEATNKLLIDLNGGSLTSQTICLNGTSYTISSDPQTGARYIEIKYKTSLAGLSEALKNIIKAPDDGHSYKSISTDEQGEHTLDSNATMTRTNLYLYVNYDVTVYEITIKAGKAGDSNLSFTEEIVSTINSSTSNYNINSIEYSSGNIDIKVSYGTNLNVLLETLRSSLTNLGVYSFNGYDTNPDDLSVYNVRLNSTEASDISITFLWAASKYKLDILDVYNNIILTIDNDNTHGLTITNNIIDLSALAQIINNDSSNSYKVTGYTFANSFKTLGGNTLSGNYTLSGYSTIVAVYTPNQYKVTFYQNYSESDSNTYSDYTGYTLTYNDVITRDIINLVPTRPGYNFVGWSYDRSGQILTVDDKYTSAKDVSLYAIWTPINYEIHYELIFDKTWNDPSLNNTELPQNHTYGNSSVNINASISLEGYNFQGYSLTNNATSPSNSLTINDSDFISYAKDDVLTVYVYFKIKTYEVKFSGNSGTYGSNSETTVTMNYNDIPNNHLPQNPVRQGYVFTGYDNGSYLAGPVQSIPVNTTFSAQWSEAQYTVTFIIDGTTSWSNTYAYNSTISLTISTYEEKKPGYEITGFKDEQGNEYCKNLTGLTVNGDMTLEAVWNIKSYNLSITINGLCPTSSGLLCSLKKLFGEPIESASTSTNSNETTSTYIFSVKYNTSLTGISTLLEQNVSTTNYYGSLDKVINTMPAGDLAITISYVSEPNQSITVSIEIVGVDNVTSPLEVVLKKCSDNYNITAPSYEGYKFTKWQDSSNADITCISKYISGKACSDSPISVKAVYEPITFAITYTTNLAGTDTNTVTANYGTTYGEALANKEATIDGYSFIGWYVGDICVTDKQIYSDNTVHARYQAVNYQIKFQYNETTICTGILKIGDTIILPTISENGSETSFEVGQNYIYYNPHFYILNSSSQKVYFNELFANNLMQNLEKIAGTLGIEVTSQDNIISLTFTLELDPIKYEIRFRNDLGLDPVTFDIDHGIKLTTPPSERPYYNFVGFGKNSDNLIELNKEYCFTYLIALFDQNDLLNKYVELDAFYTPITYTINQSVTFTVEDTYVDLSNLTVVSKQGYDFIGFVINGNYYLKETPVELLKDLMISTTNANITLDPAYTPKVYTISFATDGGSFVPSQNILYNETINVPTNPTKPGYKFMYWSLEGTNNEFDFTKTLESQDLAYNITLYAVYEAISYTISFNWPDIASISVKYLEKIGDALPTPVLPSGFIFEYWYYVDGEDIVRFSRDTIYNYTSDITLEMMTSGTYAVDYVLNGGINNKQNKATIEANDLRSGSEIIYAPSRTGYTFLGWYLTSDFSGDEVLEITLDTLEYALDGTITLYAKWEINKYNVVYKDEEGNTIRTETIDYGNLATFTKEEKDGYIFDNWYLDESVYDFNTPITKDITLVAKYKLRELKESVVINGETINVVINTLDGVGIQADAKIKIELIEDTNKKSLAEKLLEAFGLVSRVYDIKLVDGNGVELEPNGEVRVTLTLPSGELAGDKDYQIYHLSDNLEEYEHLDSHVKNDNIEFYTNSFSPYAIVISDKVVSLTWLWILLGVIAFLLIQVIIIIVIRSRKFTITFISKGVKIKNMRCKKDEEVFLPTPKRLGYRFAGWYLDSKYELPANIKTMPNEDLILYARWVEDPINIGIVINEAK